MTSNLRTFDSKRIRLTKYQAEHLVNFMYANTDFAKGSLGSRLHGKAEMRKLWADLTVTLNTLGPSKTIQKWKKVWTDLKYHSTQKFSKLNQNFTGTDGLSILDKKVLAVLDVIRNDDSTRKTLENDVCTSNDQIETRDDIVKQEITEDVLDVLIQDETPDGMDGVNGFCTEGEGQNANYLSADDGESSPSLGEPENILSSLNLMTPLQRIGQKRALSSDFPSKRFSTSLPRTSCNFETASDVQAKQFSTNSDFSDLQSKQFSKNLLKTSCNFETASDAQAKQFSTNSDFSDFQSKQFSTSLPKTSCNFETTSDVQPKEFSICVPTTTDNLETSCKNENEIIVNLLNSQQEMVQIFLSSQQEITQNLLSSQQKLIQNLQNCQQEMAKSVINFMNRRADLDERQIRLEEEKLKLEERRVAALERRVPTDEERSN